MSGHESVDPGSARGWKHEPKRPPGPRPEWLKVRLASNPEFYRLGKLLDGLALNTVCTEARCPNIFECWSMGTATFMIGGDTCTRRCAFCSVGKGRPRPLDPAEPEHVADAVERMRLRHTVITSVNRDDLPDGGAGHWAATIAAVRARCPSTTIEVLIPDFQGNWSALETVLAARPEVLSHNTETVPDLYARVRPDASYAQSLEMLRRIAQARTPEYPVTPKTGLMVGLGETDAQLARTFADLAAVGVEVLTLGQYLAPTPRHLPISRWVSPAEFDAYRAQALALGFRHVTAGPLVRSSYHAHEHVDRPLLATSEPGALGAEGAGTH